jgi:hypothetical protein
VIAHSFTWQDTSYGYFGLSLENKLRDPVDNVNCLVIFYNEKDQALDSAKVWVPGNYTSVRIEPGAAVRVVGKVTPEVVRLSGFIPHTATGNDLQSVRDPDGLVHGFPASWTDAQINAYLENYWKQRQSRTKVRILGFEVIFRISGSKDVSLSTYATSSPHPQGGHARRAC